MKLKQKLFRESRKGTPLVLKIEVREGENILRREHGQVDGKLQTSISVIEGKNIGKANETSPNEQAVKEAEAIVVRKTKEGYRETLEKQVFSFNPLPEGFTPSKPIGDPPPGVTLQGGYEDYYAERKYNGVNLLRVTDLDGVTQTYTRGIENITHIVTEVPEIVELNKIAIERGSITSYEFIYTTKEGKEVPKFLRGLTNPKTTKEKAKAKYKELIKSGGSFSIKIFDDLFFKGKDITKTDYEDRKKILLINFFNDYKKYEPWSTKKLTKSDIDYAIKNEWEGFILRKLTGSESYVEYTMNGKAYRRGAWKFKFLWTEDFFIFEFMTSNAGRLKGLPARFHLGKLNSKDEVIDCGWCGPGTLSTEDLENLGSKLGYNNPASIPYKTGQTVNVPLTVEIKYSSKQHESDSLEHPIILETREDKGWKECLIDDVPKLL